MFKDRKDAAEKLALALPQYQHQNVLVLGIPPEGIEIAYHLAHDLAGELGFIIAQKIAYPGDPETCFASITEDGTQFIASAARRHLSLDEIEELVERAKHEMHGTIRLYREENVFPALYRRTVILTDDGSAPASALQAVIDVCRRRLAEKVIVALPTATERLEQILLEIADEVCILERHDFYQVSNDDYDRSSRQSHESALYFLKQWQQENELHISD
jgi:predicted phosphoribosyltransferase